MESKIVGLVVTFLIFMYGVHMLYSRRKYKKIGVKTKGIISSIVRELNVSYPIVVFKTQDGREIIKRYSIGTNMPIFAKGEVVDVLYLQDNPEHYIIDSIKCDFIAFTLMIFGTLGIIILTLL